MKLKSTKLFASVVGLAMVLTTVAVPASAQTTAELTAQINSLLAMIAQLQAQVAGGTTSTGASVMFTSDLTIGSTGAQVTALQSWLVSKGYLVMPAGVSMGYFGSITKTALAKYQAEAGISPAAGYFGPITRAKLNAMGGTGTGTGTGSTGGSTGISTPGVEGTLTVTSNNSGIVSTVYEGDSMRPILGMSAEAKNSDIAIQRIKINLGTNSKIYTKGYSKLYVTDGSNVLASVDLNSSTVVKESSTYYVTVSGFNLIVPKGQKKQIVIKADVMGSIDSSDRSTLSSIAVSLANNGVRGVDGAGIDQYSPTTGSDISKTVTFSAELAETATLTMSLNSSSPKKNDVVATSGSSENELDKLTLLTFDVKAEKDDVKITDLAIAIAKTGSGAATASSTVYIFDGSTELDNATLGAGTTALFNDIDYVVPKDTTKTLTVKADIRNANGTVATFTASASTTGTNAIVTENTNGDSVTESGSATGYAIGVRNVGPEISLVSKSITTSGVPQVLGSTPSTSTLAANFSVKIKAVGGPLTLGLTQATSSPLFSSTTSFTIYRNGAIVTDVGSAATSTSFTVDSICTTAGLTNTCTLAEGAEITVPVSFQIQGRNPSAALSSGLYSIGIAGINWSGNTSNFMSGENDWRTADVSFP